MERDRLQSAISQGVLIIEAQRAGGTMHTADFAIGQQKRIACYYYKMLEAASGNQYLEETRKAQILKTKADLLNFIRDIKSGGEYKQEYEQLKFDFGI